MSDKLFDKPNALLKYFKERIANAGSQHSAHQ